MKNSYWQTCLKHLERELPTEDFNTWINSLQYKEVAGRGVLLAPNEYVRDKVSTDYLERIRDIFEHLGKEREFIVVEITANIEPVSVQTIYDEPSFVTGLDDRFRFDNFVPGKSNQLALAAAQHVAQKPGLAYNPLVLYGSTGLGKTHLLHAAGHLLQKLNPKKKVKYVHSGKFLDEMIAALSRKRMDVFKQHYRTVGALLVDDIQFFAKKTGTQEEFFQTFNALFESRQQIILTSDQFPKDLIDIEARLKSRFGWGLSVSIDPPDFETRVAILLSKAREREIELDEKVAYLIAKRLKSHVRDLEGALSSLHAYSNFSGQFITVELAKEVLRDHLLSHDQRITILNIQKAVSKYYGIRMADLSSRRKTRAIVRPRQMAMALCKELTEHSLVEIGAAFGGRDHTTVLHANRKINELRNVDRAIRSDWVNLMRQLTE